MAAEPGQMPMLEPPEELAGELVPEEPSGQELIGDALAIVADCGKAIQNAANMAAAASEDAETVQRCGQGALAFAQAIEKVLAESRAQEELDLKARELDQDADQAEAKLAASAAADDARYAFELQREQIRVNGDIAQEQIKAKAAVEQAKAQTPKPKQFSLTRDDGSTSKVQEEVG